MLESIAIDPSGGAGEWLSIAEAAPTAGGYQRLWRLVQSGALTSRKIGGRVQVLRTSVDAIVRQSAPLDGWVSPVPPQLLGMTQALLELRRRVAAAIAELEDECQALERVGEYADAATLRDFVRVARDASLVYDPPSARWMVVPTDNRVFSNGAAV